MSAEMTERRCEVTDLYASQCGHCTGRTGDRETPAEDRKLGPWFAARFPGRCSDCGDRIHEDGQIRADGDGGYLCEACGEDTP